MRALMIVLVAVCFVIGALRIPLGVSHRFRDLAASLPRQVSCWELIRTMLHTVD